MRSYNIIGELSELLHSWNSGCLSECVEYGFTEINSELDWVVWTESLCESGISV